MAKANLPVNFKDDILKENMNGKRRFNMIQNSDGTVSFEDVTNYTQVGSTFGAAQINATNEAVNNAADASKIMDDLDTIKANTQSGYIAGALAVKALSSNLGLNYGEFISNADKTEKNIITLSDLEPGIYEMVIHSSKINSSVSSYTCDELNYEAINTAYDGRRLFLINFKTSTPSVNIVLSGQGLVTYITRKIQ